MLLERITRRRRDEALQRIADWEMALAISLAPHTKDRGQSVSRQLQQMRWQIETGGVIGVTSDAENELHAKIIELNKRRLARKEAG